LDVDEAVATRRAVRGFTDRPVPIEVLQRVLSTAGDPWDEREYEMYPPALNPRTASATPRSARSGAGHSALRARIGRRASGPPSRTGNPQRTARCSALNRDLGLPQWADVGMYLQTVILLLRAEGLHSCPQVAWSQVRKTVAEILSPREGLILFCGMSIGFEDVTVGCARPGPGPLDETVTTIQD
jgi:nitroreductase